MLSFFVDAVTLALPLPAAGQRKDIRGRLAEDLSRHPWANLPVTVSLKVSDGIGQEGVSAPMAMVLPGRRFFDPLAAALIEMRRDLLWSRTNAARSAEVLRAISWQPDGFMDKTLYEGLRGAIGTLESGNLTDEAGQEIEKLPSRRRRREIVVLARQPERLADLLFDEVTVPAQQADPRSPCVRTAEIQGQIDAVLITARQGNMRFQGRYGRPGLAAQGPFHIGGKIAGNLLQPLVGQIKIAGNIHPVHPFFHGSDHTSRKIITFH